MNQIGIQTLWSFVQAHRVSTLKIRMPFCRRLLLWALLLSWGGPIVSHAEMDTSLFQTLAIQDRGRKKPFTAFAREATQFITGKTSWKDRDGHATSDLEFILSLWLAEEKPLDQPTILINSRPLWNKIADPEVKANHLSYNFLSKSEAFQLIQKQANLFNVQHPNDKSPPLLAEVHHVTERLQMYQGILDGSLIRILPPVDPQNNTWEVISGQNLSDLKSLFADQGKDPSAAGEFLNRLHDRVLIAKSYNANSYPPLWLLQTESIYLRIHPWRWAWICYALSAFILGTTLTWQRERGGWLGYGFGILGFLFQIYGFASRIVIAGRPPVTNMYESIIWVAFGAVLFSLVLEGVYRSRYFLLSATPFAVAALIFTDLQPTLFDPSIHPLVAVLNNNFWLSIHVLTITLSYGAFALALGLGHVTVIKSLNQASPKDLSLLYSYTYRALQIGILLLATGTILGGVWANYSWGRFWDWDPKETWALITLLMYLALLHGRLAGWWGGFGLAIGSILCFQSVVMAWYGVNFVLGTGLHSYGFGTGGLPYAASFVACEILLVTAASWRKKHQLLPT